MKESLTLYTPGTGLPDLEMRIALGLCVAALNAIEPEKISLIELDDRYAVEVFDSDAERKIALSLAWICSNTLADESFFRTLPGVHSRWYKQQAKNVALFGRKLFAKPQFPEAMKQARLSPKYGSTSSSCGHEFDPQDEVFTALLVLSPQIGKPPVRDRIDVTKNLPICPYCGILALTGAAFFQVDLWIRNSDDHYFCLPRFHGTVPGNIFSSYLAATKRIENFMYDIPAKAGILTLFGNFPNISEALGKPGDAVRSFYTSRYASAKAGARYGTLCEQTTEKEVSFLSYSVYNRALTQQCYHNRNRSELLGLLSRALQNNDIGSALNFARAFVSSTDAKAMLPWSTTEFFAREVSKMDKTLLEGEKFKVIKEVADMLQHFVRDCNFGYVDNLRKARDADEFARLLLDAQRQAQSVLLDPKKQDRKPFLPGQNTIQQLLQLVNEDREQFQAVQTLVALLAFTQYKREV